MKLEHKFVVPAPVEQAWAAFNDLERVVPCFPGATLTSYDGDDFSGSCKVKLGPVSLQYAGTGTFVERDPSDHHAVIEAKGKDRRGNSTASVRVTTRLNATGDEETSVTVDTDLTITGRPAQFGRGLIQDVSNQLLSQFVTCLTTTLTSQPAATTAASTTSTADEPTTSPTAGAEPPGPVRASGPAHAGAPTGAGVSGDATSDTAASEPAASDSAASEPAPTLDLGAALVPALARRARPYLIGAVLALVLRRLLRR